MNNKTSRAGCMLTWWLLALGAIGGALLLVDRALTAVEGLAGPWLYAAVIGLEIVALAILTVGGAVAIVRWLVHRSKLVHPDPHTALYPQVRVDRQRYLDLNEPGSQRLATLAQASRRPTAAMVGAVLDASALPDPAPLPELPAPELRYPQRVDVYDAPMPQKLALPIGVDGRGQQVSLPLHNLGNVIIGGLPGYGKTELLGAMVAGLLRQDASGQRVKVAIVDPKRADFSQVPGDLASMAYPVARDLDTGRAILGELRAECDRRFELLEQAGARNLAAYHTKGGDLPYLVAIVDELASYAGDDRFNEVALYLARMGRAAGITLVLATQRPSASVVSSDLRAMAGAAVAFRCRTANDSRVILDAGDAADLPATPGRCIVSTGEFRTCQAYASGLESGLFDRFLATLPRGIATPADWWQGSMNTGIPGGIPDETYQKEGIPVFRTDDTAGYTDAQVDYIRARYAALGSLKAVQRELYNQEGGHWFYEIRNAVQNG